MCDFHSTSTTPQSLIPRFLRDNDLIAQYVCPKTTGDVIWAFDKQNRVWIDLEMGYPLTIPNSDTYLIERQRTNNPYTPVPSDCHYITTEGILTTTICTMPPECGQPYKWNIPQSTWYPWGVVLCYGTGISPDYDDSALTLAGSGMVQWYDWYNPSYEAVWPDLNKTKIMFDGTNYYHTPSEANLYLFDYMGDQMFPSSNWWDQVHKCYNYWRPEVLSEQFKRILIGPKLFDYKVKSNNEVVNNSILLQTYPLPWFTHGNTNRRALINPMHVYQTFKMGSTCIGPDSGFHFLPYECEQELPDCALPLKFRTLTYASLVYEAIMSAIVLFAKTISHTIIVVITQITSKIVYLLARTHFIIWFPLYYHTRDYIITIVSTVLLVSASYCVMN